VYAYSNIRRSNSKTTFHLWSGKALENVHFTHFCGDMYIGQTECNLVSSLN